MCPKVSPQQQLILKPLNPKRSAKRKAWTTPAKCVTENAWTLHPQLAAVCLWWLYSLHTMNHIAIHSGFKVSDDVVGASARLLLPSKARPGACTVCISCGVSVAGDASLFALQMPHIPAAVSHGVDICPHYSYLFCWQVLFTNKAKSEMQ